MPVREEHFDTLAEQGWVVCDDVADPGLCQQLHMQCKVAWDAGEFRSAQVGHGAETAEHKEVRGDFISWLEPEHASGASHEFLIWSETLQRDLNQYLFAGLNSAEFHYAHYPPGQGYKKHIDQHRLQRHRKISLVLYLNREWGADDGGELCIYAPADADSHVARILPQPGRLVLFRSDLIPHEVLPCKRPRWSLTGWFRTDHPALRT